MPSQDGCRAPIGTSRRLLKAAVASSSSAVFLLQCAAKSLTAEQAAALCAAVRREARELPRVPLTAVTVVHVGPLKGPAGETPEHRAARFLNSARDTCAANPWRLEKAISIVANIVYVLSDAVLRRRALVGPRLVVQANLSRPTFKPKRVYVPPTGSPSAPDPWLMDIVAMRDRRCFQAFLMAELCHAEWVALWRGKDIRILALPHRGGRGGDPLTHATVRFGKKGVWHLYFEQAPQTKVGIRLVRGTCLHPKASIGC